MLSRLSLPAGHAGGAGRPRRAGAVVRRAVTALAVATVAVLTSSVVAQAATAGTATIIEPGLQVALNSGGSRTLYGVELPNGASCPGDTEHQGYHVFSYLVPQGVSPTAVSFKTGVPNKWFGYIDDGSYFGAVNTAIGTGQIQPLPEEFTWSRLTPHDLFRHGARAATWEGGIACADTTGTVTNYWNSEIVFTASSSDPGGFTWRVIHQPPVPGDPFVVVGVVLLGVAAVATVTAVVLARRKDQAGRTHPPDAAGEPAAPEAGPGRPLETSAPGR